MKISLSVGLRSDLGNLHWANTTVPWPRAVGGREVCPVGDMWTAVLTRIESTNANTAFSFEFLPRKYDKSIPIETYSDKEVLHRITFRSHYPPPGEAQDIPVRFHALGLDVEGYMTLQF